MKVAFYTLGCKTNQFETQALERMFAARGHEVVDFKDVSDVYIVNTCTCLLYTSTTVYIALPWFVINPFRTIVRI